MGKKFKINFSRRQKTVLLVILSIITLITVGVINYKDTKVKVSPTNREIARAMTYAEANEGDEDVEGTPNVKFDAFFLRDLDGDGNAEKIRGTCNELGNQDTLYMELKVQTEGSLEDAQISIDGKNFYLQTSLPKDNEFKSNYIGNNIDLLEFNTLNSGSQKLITGIVRSGDYNYTSKTTAAIENNINNYSQVNNVTLTGTYIRGDGARIRIEKKVDFHVDWYAKASASIHSTIQSENITKSINLEEGSISFKFNISTAERYEKLILKSNHVEGEIPEINGYLPIGIEYLGKNAEFNYDETTRTFTLDREAEIDENGKIIRGINSDNKYEIKVVYSLEAYQSLGVETIELQIPVRSYYEGYNNPNPEFDNPYRTNLAQSTIILNCEKEHPKQEQIYNTDFDVKVGKDTWGHNYTYAVSKQKPLKLYNKESEEEKNDTYTVMWKAFVGTQEELGGIVMKEATKDGNRLTDIFVKTDSTEESMEELVSNVGIYFGGAESLLGSEGWIKIYDDDTGNLIATFTKENWSRYGINTPYRYALPVKHIRIETSNVIKNAAGLYVYNIKEIDDEKLIDKYDKSEFDQLQYINSSLVGYIESKEMETTRHTARYVAPESMANLIITKDTMSTQETEENVEIKIQARVNEILNQVEWKNGTFLVKLPEEIIDAKLKKVEINNTNVTLDSYELIKENGQYFVKILTYNATPQTYTINIKLDLSTNPRMATATRDVELYATNENGSDYYYKSQDIYDINDNSNTEEQVYHTTAKLSMISPSSLLTTQIASNYDDNGSTAMAPQIVELKAEYDDQDDKTVDIGIDLINNYSSTISEVSIIGKIPFEGNSYVLSGNNLNSEFNTTMREDGLRIPEELKDVITVYYSENENPDKDLNKEENGWKTKEEVENWDNIKTFLIDFEDYIMPVGKTLEFGYTIKIPRGTVLNKTTYSHHGIEFCLDTDQGKYRTNIEPNKLGFRLTRKYDFEIQKYQENKEKLISGIRYSIKEITVDGEGNETQEIIKTAVTNSDGKIQINDLVAEKIYEVKEMRATEDYELNSDAVRFIAHMNEDGTLSIEKISGVTREEISVEKDEVNNYKITLKLEDKVKARLKITKKEIGTENRIEKVYYKVTGEGLPLGGKILSTNKDGELTFVGLSIDKEYVLEEVKANGYYLSSPITFKIVKQDEIYEIEILDGEVAEKSFSEEDSIPVLSIVLEDEKIPTYNLEIAKIKRVEETELNNSKEIAKEGTTTEETTYLEGAKFKLYKGNQELGEYITDSTGKLTITELYLYESERNLNQTYTLKEVMAPQGYTKAKDITFKVQRNGETLEFVEELVYGQTAKTYTVEGNTVKVVIEDTPVFKLVKKDAETQMPVSNAKFAIYNIDAGETPATNSKNEILGTKEIINGKEYYTVTTNENGEVTAELSEGLYKAVEVQAPDKYDIKDCIQYFGIGTSIEGKKSFEKVWNKNVLNNTGDDITSAIKTSDGGTLVIGVFRSNMLDLGNGIVLTKNGSAYYSAGIVIKYNKNMETEWAKIVEGSTNSICETKDGNILVGGTNNNSGFIIEYNSNGEEIWSKSILQIGIRSIVVTDDNEIFIVGDLGTYCKELGLEIRGKKNGYIAKFDSNRNIEWAKVIGGENSDYIKSLSRTSDGGVLVGGYFNSTRIDLENNIVLEGDGSLKGMILKFNTLGNVEWTKTIGEKSTYINSVKETSDGGYIVVGEFGGDSLDLGNDVILKKANNNGYNNTVMIIKYDMALEVQWTKTQKYYKNVFIQETDDNKYLLYNGTIIKYNSVGEVEWENTEENDVVSLLQTTYSEYLIIKNKEISKYSMIELPQTNVEKEAYVGVSGKIVPSGITGYIVAGDFASAIDLENNIVLNSVGGTDIAIIKYSSMGNIEWGRSIGGEEQEQLDFMISTSDGGVIVVGSFTSSSIDMGNNIVLNLTANMLTRMIVKINSDGEIVWAKAIGNSWFDEVTSVYETKDSGYIVTGNFYSNEIYLENDITLRRTKEENGIIIKYDINGNLEWANTVEISDYTEINSIIETNDGGYAIVGNISDRENGLGGTTIYLEDGTIIVMNNHRAGMVLKVDSKGNKEWIKLISGEGEDSISSIVQTNDGGYLVNSYIESKNIDIGNGIVLNGPSNILIKFNSLGNVEWTKNGEGDIMQQQDGGFIISGSNLFKITNEGVKEWSVSNPGYSSIQMFDGSFLGVSYGKAKKFRVGLGIPEVQELVIENKRKEFKISTGVKEVNGKKGGSISGSNLSIYEKVKYGDNSKREIIMTPDKGYEIIGITVNGEKHEFIVGEDGTYVMPILENILEDKYIEVTYAMKYEDIEDDPANNRIVINKIDSKTKESIPGVTFKLEQQEQKDGFENIIGDIAGNGTSIQETDYENPEDISENLVPNAQYSFVEENGSYVPNNLDVQETSAYSYIQLDLRGKQGEYAIVANAEMENTGNACLYVGVSEYTYAPGWGNIVHLEGKITEEERTITVPGGTVYYIHLGYENISNTSSNVKINSINVYPPKEFSYEFVEKDGRYISNNQGKDNTCANSYIPIDLTGNIGKYELIVNAQVSSEPNGDFGYMSITESTDRIDYKDAEINISGTVEPTDYTMELEGGKQYYLQLGYYKNDYYSIKEDTFTINSINLTAKGGNAFTTEIETNSEGQAITQIPFGKYKITEINAPEKYVLSEEPLMIDFTKDGQKEFTIENTLASKVIVHHYKANRNEDGSYEYTQEQLVEDEVLKGKPEETYTTSPKLDSEKYELIKDEAGNYIIPENATGMYIEGSIEVNYYYVEKEIPLTVYHYIEGTNIKVPLIDGEEAPEEIIYGKEGEEYSTNEISREKLSSEYELVEVNGNTTGVYQVEEVFVTYYYKKIERNIVINKYAEDGETPLEGVKFKIRNKSQNSEDDERIYSTDLNGKIKVALEVGEYEIIEIETAEGYMLPENVVTEIVITRETSDEENINITNEKARGEVIVHYYLEGTTEKVIEDEIKTGVIGEIFATKPSDLVPEYCEYVGSSEITSGKYSEEKQEVIYYYRLKEYQYKIEYYYSNIKDEEKTETGIATYGDNIEEYEDKEKFGYRYERAENLPLKVSEKLENNIIKIYYVPDENNTKELTYTVEYYKDNEKVDLDTQVVKEEIQILKPDILKVDKENINIIDKYTGYELEKIESNNNVISNLPDEVENETVIKVYYVLKDANLTVKYLDKYTGKEISEKVVKTAKFFEEYDITQDEKEIDGYTLIERPEELTGTYTEEEQEKIYYYAKNTQVIVKYLEKDNTPEDNTDNTILSEQIVINGYEGQEYSTEQKEIENYTFIENTQNTQGTLTRETIEVIYYYLQNTKVTVNHIDKKTGTKLEVIEKEGLVGDTYTAVAKDFEKYVLVERPENEIVLMTKEEIVLNYYYVHISSGVVEKHIDITTNEILESQIHEGNEGDSYKTEQKEFEGYDIVQEKLPTNAEGIMTIEGIEVRYYYIRRLSVKVEYIDKVTGEKIIETNGKDSTEIINGHEGDSYKTEEKQFKDYVIITEMIPDNKEGIMKVVSNSDGTINTEIIVRYYYVHTSSGVIEKHIDIKTNKLLDKETKYEGNEGDSYKTEQKEFDGYDIVKDKLPTNAEGKMEKDLITVNYYYIRKMKVVVEYIDKLTESVIDTETILGHEDDLYETEEKIIKNYKLVEKTPNTSGKMSISEDGTIYVKYYYVRETAGVKEEHIDINTGKILDEASYTGYEGDKYETQPKQFKGYVIVQSEYPENAKGTMTKEEIKVKYYYAKQAKVIVEYIDQDTKAKIIDDITIEGYDGKKYSTEVKVFDGYKLFDKPQNAEGKMRVVENEDGELETITYVRYYYTKVVDTSNEEKPKAPDTITNIYNNITNTNDTNPSSTVSGKTDPETSQNQQVSNISSEKTPSTGDVLPVINIAIIAIVVILNILYSIRKTLKLGKNKFIK